jgi:hypothetical protein
MFRVKFQHVLIFFQLRLDRLDEGRVPRYVFFAQVHNILSIERSLHRLAAIF